MAMMHEAFSRLKAARKSEYDVQEIMINLALVHDSYDAHAAEPVREDVIQAHDRRGVATA